MTNNKQIVVSESEVESVPEVAVVKTVKKTRTKKAEVESGNSDDSEKVVKRVVAKAKVSVAEKETVEFLWEDDEKYFLGETKLTTEKLRELFGEWQEIEWAEEDLENKDKRFVYNITIGKKNFVVYDKLGEGEDGEDEWDSLDEIEWYANGDGGLRTLNGLMSR